MAGNNIRIGWEEDLFGDAYHDATPFERCKYGALNVTGAIWRGLGDPRGKGQGRPQWVMANSLGALGDQ